MRNNILLLLLLWFSVSLSAEEIPANYYDAINGKKDAELKTALSQIIYPVNWADMTQSEAKPNFINTQYDAGNRCKYGTRAVNEKHQHKYTWDGFIYTDTQNDGTVWDMYSPYIHYMAADSLGAVSIPDMEIEHCFPKGWWGGKANNNENDAFRDLHHLNPANARANNHKSDYPPGYAKTDIKADNGIFKMGKNSDYGTFFVFEPCDEYKGDFARAYFYIATAYEQFVWKCDYLDNGSYLEFKPWLQQVLLEWHRLDPVSEKEIMRNDRVSDIQHNRNPFIDYPELVEYIWGNKQNNAVDLAHLTYTGSENYTPPVETLVSRALPATQIKKTGFVANWKNSGKESYELDVFTSETTGHNDTILNMPYFNSGIINADKEHFSYIGSFGTTGIGKNSVTFGTNSNPLVLTIKGINIPENTRLVVRAMAPLKLNNTEGSQMSINAGGTSILQPLTFDETYYSFDLAKGTTQIVISQGNGKNFNVQQLFIVSGDETTTHTSLEGYPQTVTGTSFEVSHTMDEDVPVYYTITPKGLSTSMPVAVLYDGTDTPTELPRVCNSTEETSTPRKEIRNGQLVIIRNASIYTTLGQTIQ